MLFSEKLKGAEGDYNRVIEFFIIAITETHIKKENNPHQYYGHNFNDCFRRIELNLRDSLYTVLCLYVTMPINENKSWAYVAIEYLKTWRKEIKRPMPPNTHADYLLWNLYYQMNRIKHLTD